MRIEASHASPEHAVPTGDTGTRLKTEPKAATDQWQETPHAAPAEARYNVDPVTHQPVVQVLDAETREVVRETPPEPMREVARNLQLIVEHAVDTRA